MSKPASFSVGTFGKPGRRLSATCASTRILPARMCSPASAGSITIMLTWPPRSAAMRSPPPGKEMKAHCAPVLFCSSWRTTLSRLVTEPPDCPSCPGLFFAAATKSCMLLYGASDLTAMTAGSSTRRAIGVRSLNVTLASVLVSGLLSHTPVKKPIVFWSPFFSARYAAATALLPPGLLTTCMRTGSSFSFSIMSATARARTSLPPPGPVCTTASTGRVGLNPCPCAGGGRPPSAASAAAPANMIRIFIEHFLLWLLERLQAPGVELVEQRYQQDQHRERQHRGANRPSGEDRELPLRHHERLAQRPLHPAAEDEPQDERCGRIVEPAHEVAEHAEPDDQRDVEQASGSAVDADDGDADDQRVEDVVRRVQHLREDRHQRQVEHEQHHIADVHARHQAPEQRGIFGDEERPRPEAPQHERGEQHRRGSRARNAEREQRHERSAGLRVVRAFGGGHALDRTLAEFVRAPRHRLLHAIRNERSNGGPGTRENADQEPEHRAVQEREAAILKVLERRQEVAQPLRHGQRTAFGSALHAGQHLAKREHADGDHHEVDAREELQAPEGKARGGAEGVGADAGEPEADQHGEQRLQHRAPRKQHHHGEAERHEREIFRRTERKRYFGERRRNQHQADYAYGAGDERRDRRDAKRGPGAALAGHGVAVEAGDHRGGFAGDVQQDRGRRTAVLGAVVDAREHDHRAGRIHQKRERQEHRDRGRWAEARHDTHDRAEHHAHEAPEQVRRLQGDREALQQARENLHALRKIHAEEHREKQIEAAGKANRNGGGNRPRAPIHHRHDEERERREADREARELEQRDCDCERSRHRGRTAGTAPIQGLGSGVQHARDDEGGREQQHRDAVPKGEESGAGTIGPHVIPAQGLDDDVGTEDGERKPRPEVGVARLHRFDLAFFLAFFCAAGFFAAGFFAAAGFLYLPFGTSSHTVPPGARNFTGMTPASLMISQPYDLTCLVAASTLSTSTAKWWMHGPSPAACDSADSVPASYWMSATSRTPSERWREV